MPERVETPRLRPSAFASRALAALLAASILAASAPQALASGVSKHIRRPTDTSLARLEQYEPYIAYFTSLTYGPTNSTVSPNYIRALILTESAAQKQAVSNKGARGLTQIMPETGRLAINDLRETGIDFRYVDETRLRRYSSELLFDPAINILIACYLGALYHADYSGRSDLSAAAWNAGPHAVLRYGNRTPPYQETRGMVHRLVGYLNYFTAENPSASYSVGSARMAPPRVIPAIASRVMDTSHPRWDTNDAWNHPGWDEKKVTW